MKYCPQCRKMKSETAFYKNVSECKLCHKKRQHKYHKKVKRTWYSRNKEYYNRQHAKWQADRKEYMSLRVGINNFRRKLKARGFEITYEKLPYGKLTLDILRERHTEIKKYWGMVKWG